MHLSWIKHIIALPSHEVSHINITQLSKAIEYIRLPEMVYSVKEICTMWKTQKPKNYYQVLVMTFSIWDIQPMNSLDDRNLGN